MTEKELMKLQNGSDVRGIALEGVEGEKVNLRPEAANLIAAAFVKFLLCIRRPLCALCCPAW